MPLSVAPLGASPLAIVTGASSGIGAQVARLLAQRGYRLLLVARRLQRLEVLAQELAPLAPVVAVHMDLALTEQIQPAMQELLAEHGPAQVLVNNAGFGLYQRFTEHQVSDHQRLMAVNYLAPVMMIHAALPEMLRRGRGHVINIASMSTKMGPWGHAGYAAAKSALVCLTQTLAAEHTGTGVHFSYVNPGIVRTAYFENPTFLALYAQLRRHAIGPEQVASAVVSLLERPRLELCVPRHYRVLDLIRAISPELARKLVGMRSKVTSSDRPVETPTPATGRE